MEKVVEIIPRVLISRTGLSCKVNAVITDVLAKRIISKQVAKALAATVLTLKLSLNIPFSTPEGEHCVYEPYYRTAIWRRTQQ